MPSGRLPVQVSGRPPVVERSTVRDTVVEVAIAPTMSRLEGCAVRIVNDKHPVVRHG